MKNFAILFIAFCLSIAGYAQTATQYTFSRATGTYATISGLTGTTATTGLSDDDLTLTNIPINFNFVFCGATSTLVSACSNGFLSLSNSSSTEYDNFSSTVPGPGHLMPFWNDLDGSVASATAYYQTSGTAPTRVFTMQWGHTAPAANRWGNLYGTGRAVFQVKLYENSNVIQFVYGAGNFASNAATIGIANSTSDYRTLASAGATTSVTTFSTNVASSPAANSVMTWTPPPTIAATPSTMVFTTGPGITTPGTNVTLTAYGLTSGSVTVTAPANFQIFNGTSWVTSMTVSTSAAAVGTYINTAIPVRFVGPVTIGVYTGNLTFASTGATTQNVALTGNVTAPCSGAPTPGTVNATVTTGSCFAYSSTLSLTGATVAAGITYQWQTSPDNASWSPVAGATNATYTATVSTNIYYRCQLTCSALPASPASTPGVLLSLTSCIIMPASGSGSTTTCGAQFYDSGGPSGNYTDNQSGTYTIYPGTAGTKVVATFTQLYIEACCDNLNIYNGNSTGAPLLGTYNGEPHAVPFTITSTAADGSLTFAFTSDFSVSYAGWAATITNTTVNPITAQPAASTSACQSIAASLSLTATGTNTYQWFNNGTTNSNSGGTLIAGATNTTYSPSTASLGTTYYYCVVRNACNISYSSNPAAVIVNAIPAAITGTASVCTGLTTSLFDATSSGTWSSSNSLVASVGTSGIVTGVATAGGNATITYTVSGCKSTRAVTVYPLPTAITGTMNVCVNAITSLNSTPALGTWSSASPGIGTVNSGTGVVTGISAGLTTITYTAPTTCIITANVSVNPLPNLTITPSSPATICLGNNTSFTASAPVPPFTLLSQDFNSGLGSWTITNISGNPSTYWQIATSPAYAGVAGDGTPMMQAVSDLGATNTILTSPAFSTVGYGSANLLFNQYLISVPPDVNVSVEYSTNGGASWSLLLDQTGIITAGADPWNASAPNATIALPAAALGQNNVKLRWNYNGGSLYWFIDNISVQASLPPATYAWTGGSDLSCNTCASPVITPVTTGTHPYSVTATTSAGCVATSTATVSVNPLPAAITGTLVVCQGATTPLNSTSPGGTWSSSAITIATVGSTGIVTGVNPGTATITYTLSTGCRTTIDVTVNQSPATITGPSAVCSGLTVSLNESISGGAWSSSAIGTATVGSTGIVTGGTAGTVDISYTLPNLCYTLKNITVNPLPSPIGGIPVICEGATTTLTDVDALGTWTSSAPGIATVDPSLGTVTGILAGTTTITYTLPTTCIITTDVTVNPMPAAITGTPVVCENATTILSDITPDGTWSSQDPGIATIDASGTVTGVLAGNTDITFALSSGCMVNVTVTVNHTPVPSTGNPEVCEASTITLSNSDAGGTWSSSATGIATVDASSGIISGLLAGNADISYTLSTGCYTIANLTVDPLPASITGANVVCENATTTLSDATANGTWSSGATGTAIVDASGTVTGIFQGVTDITYVLSTGCMATTPVTVNHTPVAIAGNPEVCEASTTMLSNSDAGGNWSSSATGIATIDASSGLVTGLLAGNTDITYTLPATGCFITTSATVDPLPAAITGNSNVCEGLSTPLSDISANGTWSSSPAGLVSVDINTGVASGVLAGVAAITYTLPTGCIATTPFTVNPTPAAITGTIAVCEGLTTPLNSITPGGAWSSDAPLTASVSTSGLVSGHIAGSANIIYTLPAGCTATAALTVNQLPTSITGNTTVCQASTTSLSSFPATGTWSSNTTSIATIDINTGTATGVAAGTSMITYTLPTGCIASTFVSVNPLPNPIVGNNSVCQGLTTTFSNTTPGGTWNSSTPGIAIINLGGTATGISTGFTIISYSLSTGCRTVAPLVVNPLPAAITGTPVVCAGLTTTLSNTTPGGTWSSATTVVLVNNTGIVTGIAAGTTTVSYTLATGCIKTQTVTVNQLPTLITGSSSVCEGTTTVLSNSVIGGTWASSSVSNATIDVGSGMITGIAAGTTTVTYTLPTGCLRSKVIGVNPAVTAITGAIPICQGGTMPLSNATPGGLWISGNTAVATISATTGSVTGIAPGTASLTYALPNGCMAATIGIVNPLPAPVTGSFNLCPGSTATLSTVTTGGIWNSNPATTAAIDASSGLVTAIAPGMASVTYTLSTGCARTASVVVNPLPAIDTVTGGGSYCAGGAGKIVGLNTSTSGTTYKLYNGIVPSGTHTGTGTALDFGLHTAIGTYSVVATNASGCISNMSGSATISITPLVTPSVTLSSDHGDNVCAGTLTTYTATPVNGGTLPVYDWRVNGTSTGVVASTFAYIPMNGDMVTAILTSSEACALPLTASDMTTMTVTTNQMPVINISTTAADTLCLNDIAAYHAAGSYGGTAPVYTWLKNGVTNIGSGTDLSYTPANGDIVTCRLNSNYTCRLADSVASNPISLKVDSVYIPAVTITADPGQVINKGQRTTFTAVTTGAGPTPSYQWLINGGLVSGATNDTYTSSHLTNNDIVSCYVYGSGFCGFQSFNSVTMIVNDASGVAPVESVTGNIRLIPNPNNGTFVLSGTLGTATDQELSLEVTDVLGQVIYKGKATARNGAISEKVHLNNTVANGMYMLNLQSATVHATFHFVVKQ